MACFSSSFSRVFDVVGPQRPNQRRFVVAVFDDAHAGHDMASLQHFARDTADDLTEAVVLTCAVVDLRTGLLAQADQHHLHQAALQMSPVKPVCGLTRLQTRT